MLICEYNGSERANFLGTGDKTAGAQNHQTPQLPNPTSIESSRKTDQLFLSPVKTLSLSLSLSVSLFLGTKSSLYVSILLTKNRSTLTFFQITKLRCFDSLDQIFVLLIQLARSF